MATRTSLSRRLSFFAGKFLRDAFRPLFYEVETGDVHGSTLGRYYLVFDETAIRGGGTHDFRFDDTGIIPAVPTYIDVDRPRLHYFPIAIGQYALAIFHTWLRTGREEDRARFLTFADWFAGNQAADGCWYTEPDVPIYRLPGPWISAMSQGRGLSVLTRAWQLTSEARYLEGAQRALAAFETPIAAGGVAGTLDGQVTYEEYPAQPPPHVLNGMIFGLFGLWDLARAKPEDARPRALFERGAATVEALLPRYDTGRWSLYDLYHLELPGPRNPCTAHYHDMHVKQLKVLHAITGRATFATVAERWNAYQRNPVGRLWAYARKAAFVTQRRLR